MKNPFTIKQLVPLTPEEDKIIKERAAKMNINRPSYIRIALGFLPRKEEDKGFYNFMKKYNEETKDNKTDK